MRILMFGWEFPPYIAGGLGTACAGLTRGLTALGHEIVFVLPRPFEDAGTSHVELRSPASLIEPKPASPAGGEPGKGASAGSVRADAGAGSEPARSEPGVPGRRDGGGPGSSREGAPEGGFPAGAEFRTIPAAFTNPYSAGPLDLRDPTSSEEIRAVRHLAELAEGGDPAARARLEDLGVEPREVLDRLVAGQTGAPSEPSEAMESDAPDDRPAFLGSGGSGDHYGGDLLEAADRYARLAVALAKRERFDAIHAHDWLTFRAGAAVRAATGKPLIVHMHATEFDRSGEHVNHDVYEVERAGLHAADRVIAVSMLTRSICEKRYGVDPSKIDVVYNGVQREATQPEPGARIRARDRIVLFLGRITMQKGPEYFVAAAKRVLEKIDDVKFVVAGSGDMAMRMIEQAAEMGIGHKVLFTGFLRGADVPRVFRMADCYVMPSVSEPFGIAPLEAMSHDTPVIISKQSGVAEVLTHALKVDFWDVDEMANKIVAVLRYPPLSQTLRQHGAFELRRLTWTDAAESVAAVYRKALAEAAG